MGRELRQTCASATRVLEVVRRFASALAQETPGVGLGVEHRAADDRLTGHALTLKGALVHAAFFTESAAGEGARSGDRRDG